MRAAVVVVVALLAGAASAQEGAEPEQPEQPEEPGSGAPEQPAAPAEKPAPAAKTPAGPMRMIVLDLKGGGLEPDQINSLTSFVTVSLSEYSQFEVLSGADVRAMVEFEGEKQAIGCSDDTSCLAEVAGAMGARLVVFGNVSKLGSQYLLAINLFDSDEGRAVGRTAIRGATLDAVLAEVPQGTYKLVQPFLARQGHEVDAPSGGSVVTAPGSPAEEAVDEGGGFPLLAVLVPTGALLAGAGVAVTGGVLDATLGTSQNKQLDGGDFIGPALYATGGVLALAGLVAVPFLLE